MKIVDVNVLLYAVNGESEHHVGALAWWEAAISNDHERLGLPWIVVLGFLRVATNPRVFPQPLAFAAAMRTVGHWLSQPNVRLVREREDHWERLRAILEETGTAGNLTTDAHLAALAFTHNAVLVSFDNDFARFQGLRWENPARVNQPRLN